MEQFETSPLVAGFIQRMQTIVAPLEELEVNKCFALPKGELSFSVIEDFLEDASKGKRVYVVVEHESGFEVARLPDGSNRKLFYKQTRPVVSVQCGHDENEYAAACLRIVGEYANATFEEVNKYKSVTKQMKDEGVISHSYIQRRLGAVALFKNSTEGATVAIKRGSAVLVESGKLEEVPDNVAKNVFESSAKLYKIIL